MFFLLLLLSVIPRLHHTTGCQTCLTTGKPVWQPVESLFTRLNSWLYNRFDNRLEVCIHDTTCCPTGCIVYTNIQPVVKAVWQPVGQQVVSCKRGLTDTDWLNGWCLDRKLCKELCRLPILWMNPADRTVEKIHGYLSEILGILLWSPYVIGQTIIFLPCYFYLLSIFYSSPNLSGRRLDVYHTLTHGVAQVRI